MTLLAFGVVTHPGRQARVLGDALPGAPVAVGPGACDAGPALAELRRLVAAGGEAAAGAGVDLGAGFRSARLAGAAGDRRDAVLAALRVLGPEQAHRLGERAGVLVALFGPAATRPVGAAASLAVAESRWAALTLASAASDVLGPEQLETVLRLGRDLEVEGPASRLAGHLEKVFADVPRPRRARLLTDLWERVTAGRARADRRTARLATQGKTSREDDLSRRHQEHTDEVLVGLMRRAFGRMPALAEAARWTPAAHHWTVLLDEALQDAMAATVLLRSAVAAGDLGPERGLESVKAQVGAVAELLDGSLAGRPARKVGGKDGLPPRPGSYVIDLARRPGHAVLVRQRLARARDYGVVVLEAVTELPGDVPGHLHEDLRHWARRDMRAWRAAVPATRPGATWAQPVLFGAAEPLATRAGDATSGEQPDAPAAGSEEIAGDLLWVADLADALAALHGHDAAVVAHGEVVPYADWDPEQPEPEPLLPRTDSLPLALAGAAQLVSLGARVPPRCRTWPELIAGLMAGTTLAEALTGAFPVPEELKRLEGSRVPGTTVRVTWALDPHAPAGWATYMGNCIAGAYYLKEAAEGRSVLAALLDEDGQITVNLELTPRAYGWRVAEIRARFNADPDVELERRVRAWAGRLPVPAERGQARPPRPPKGPGRPPGRLFRAAKEPLSALAVTALAEAAPELRALTGDGLSGLVALRRAGAGELETRCAELLAEQGAAGFWAVTGARPLSAAIGRLEPALAARVTPLTRDEPPLGSLRSLARHEAIAQARTAEVVALRLRAALGRLAGTGHPALAAAMARRPGVEALCALTIAVTSWGECSLRPITAAGAAEIPGYPSSSLAEAPWQTARTAAAELGADLAAFEDRVAAHGLLIPGAWLGRGGWPVLWQRAHRG
ncbi:hypothetical protein [Nonomuraea typhae]|uniref:hypothetical protein n=1 Tax=Nonomuraea typhae TaxID=2603600 RepID=UPI0012FC6D71|nr:hypothetical protein [Nonomuraea typhae]